MEYYGDHGNAPGLQWQQERQTMMVYVIERQKDGGPSLTPRLGKNISVSRICICLQYGCRSGDDRRW
eukprot:8221226-Heterocapsa_arctica.AAC.1